MPTRSHTSETESTNDAFLTHSSTDRRIAARIDSFLESYRYGTPPRSVEIFRDVSDLVAGDLDARFREALGRSRFLIVASSEAAAESRWVEKEIRLFREIHAEPV